MIMEDPSTTVSTKATATETDKTFLSPNMPQDQKKDIKEEKEAAERGVGGGGTTTTTGTDIVETGATDATSSTTTTSVYAPGAATAATASFVEKTGTTAAAATAPAASTASTETVVVYKVTSNDTLMGRGAAVIGNEGNRRFRKLIQKYKTQYDSTRVRQEKDSIARKIVDTITDRGGKFLKKIETPKQAEFYNVPAGKSAWVVVNELVVLQKVKQAFRDDRRVGEGEDPSSNTDSKDGKDATTGETAGMSSANLQNTYSGMDPSALLASPAMIHPSLLMQAGLGGPGGSAAAGAGATAYSALYPQGLLGPPLMSQILAMRQANAAAAATADPFALAALRRQALLEQAILEEHQRTFLIRQALLQQQQNNTAGGVGATPPSPATATVETSTAGTVMSQGSPSAAAATAPVSSTEDAES
jgi:hypothetical protein